MYNNIIKKKLNQLPEYVSDYCYHLELNIATGSVAGYLSDIDIFFAYLIEKSKTEKVNKKDISLVDLNNLRLRDVHEFISYLSYYEIEYATVAGIRKRICSNDNGTKMRKIISMRGLFRFLNKEFSDFDSLLFEDIEIPQSKKFGNLRARLTVIEIERLLKAVSVNETTTLTNDFLRIRDFLIITWLLSTGLRVSELVGIKMEDLNIKEEFFRITRKGGKQQILPLSAELLHSIEKYLEIRQKKGLQGTHLFLSLQNKPIQTKTISMVINKYRKKAGIEKKITPHMLRRTFGTNLYNQTKDMYLVAEILGHASAETTRKYYADPNLHRINETLKTFKYS